MKNKIQYFLYKKYVLFTAGLATFLVKSGVAKAGDVDSGLRTIRGSFDRTVFDNADNIPELIAVIVRILLLVVGAIAVLFVIVGGFQYLTSGGNEENAEKGKKTLINAVIGLVMVILAWVIINVVVGTIT